MAKFEVEDDVIQDMIGLSGRDEAIQELVGGFKVYLESIIPKEEKDLTND